MGQPVLWYDKYSFLVEIDGIIRAAFTTCSDLNIEAANVQHFEGGRLRAHNSPGRVTFPEITLTRGACEDRDLYNWFKDTYDAASGTGLVTPDIYRTFDIIQMDRARNEVERYTIVDAYCRVFNAGNWDNNADEKRMESVIIQPDYWTWKEK